MSSTRPVAVAAAVLVLVAAFAPAVGVARPTSGSDGVTSGSAGSASGGLAAPATAPARVGAAALVPDNGSVTVVQNVTYDRLPARNGAIGATHRYRVGTNVTTLVVYDYPRTVVTHSQGFVRHGNGRWRWDGRTERPSLTMRITVNRSSERFEGLTWVDTANWTLANPRADYAFRHERAGWVYSWRESPNASRQVRTDGPGFVGATAVYLGGHEQLTTTANNQTIRLVRPDSASFNDSEAVLELLSRAASQLRVGARDAVVNGFVGPAPLRDGGMTTRAVGDAQDFWVTAREPVNATANLWIHEYVHTRQNLTLGTEMRWFREASASYYAGLLAVRQGIGGRDGFETFVADLHGNRAANATLTEQATWPTAYAPYAKGARVLAALDAQIRNATARNRTLLDVFRRLNGHDGTVTYPDFVTVVENVSGSPLRPWLDAHVAGPAPVSPPTRPFAYTSPAPGTDADGDGLSDWRERILGTHPFDRDTDGDGLADGTEVQVGADPTVRDTDEDGLIDGREQALGADATDRDTDGDGLVDGTEVDEGADPTDRDTDADGVSDLVEYQVGSDPADPTSTPLTVRPTRADRGEFTDVGVVLNLELGRTMIIETTPDRAPIRDTTDEED